MKFINPFQMSGRRIARTKYPRGRDFHIPNSTRDTEAFLPVLYPFSWLLTVLTTYRITARQLWSFVDLIPGSPSNSDAHKAAEKGKSCLIEKLEGMDAGGKEMCLPLGGEQVSGKGFQEQQEILHGAGNQQSWTSRCLDLEQCSISKLTVVGKVFETPKVLIFPLRVLKAQ